VKNDRKVTIFICLKSVVLLDDGLCLKSAILTVDSSLFPVLPRFNARSLIAIVGTVNELSETNDYNKRLCSVFPVIRF
jgi:hypothetical protein